MKKLSIILVFSAVIFSMLSFTNCTSQSTAQGENTSIKTIDEQINWVTFEEAIQLNAKNKKPIFIDVYTDWCGWCKRMDKATFQKPDIAAYMNKNFICVKFNAEQKEAINFKGKEYKFVNKGRRGYHELAVALLSGKMSYPTVTFLDESMNLVQSIPGYQKPEQFKPMAKFFAEKQYRK